MKRFLTALGFLTTIPTPPREGTGIEELGKSAAWFPLVGALLGALVAFIFWGLTRFLPLAVSAVLSIAAWVYLTGGLHLDGLADSFDGLLNASSPARRLEIMKDPRLGTFGALGLILTILLKVSILMVLPVGSAWLAIPLAAATARWSLLWAGRQPMARPDGLGAAFKPELNWLGMILAAILPLGLAALAGWRGIAGLILACVCAVGIFRLARLRLGGQTGDVLGLMVETVEVATLLAFIVLLK